ncbi:MAG: MGMT family protein [Clostridia bacterium]|nr:MGMT family protein [Clostridia bacterium]
MKEKTLSERVYGYLRMIPAGKVVTYGGIAAYLGKPGAARAVGNILHVNPDPIGQPCFRVVNRDGRLAENFGGGGKDVQKARLEADGIEVVGYRVDLGKYLWDGPVSEIGEDPAECPGGKAKNKRTDGK